MSLRVTSISLLSWAADGRDRHHLPTRGHHNHAAAGLAFHVPVLPLVCLLGAQELELHVLAGLHTSPDGRLQLYVFNATAAAEQWDMRAASREYVDKNCNLQLLADSIEEYFTTQGYKTQAGKTDQQWVVQARKEGALRTLLAADRAFTVVVGGEPNRLKVSFGIGRWIQNISVAVLETLLLDFLPLLFVEIPISLWSYAIENSFWGFVEKEVELGV